MMQIRSDFLHVRNDMKKCLAETKIAGAPNEPWQFVRPVANFPELVTFSAEEKALLLELKSFEVFNLVLPMDIFHNNILDGFKALMHERNKLVDRLPADSTAGGRKILSELTESQFKALLPYRLRVNSLIQSLGAAAERGAKEAEKASEHLHQDLHEKLRLDYKPVALSEEEGDDATIT